MPQLSFLPSAFASFCGNVLSVAGTTWLTMPGLVRFFKWWLFPEKTSTSIDMKGMLIVIGLYTVEVLVLWDLLKK
jgi:antibiotic biosynthesis monooxygenase (ABM) superfamily enzyme